MDAAFTSFQQRGWGIHVVSAGKRQRRSGHYASQYWLSQTVQAALRPSACSS